MDNFYFNLCMALGFTTDSNGRIIDQDSMQPVVYRQGYLLAPINRMPHRGDTILFPLYNKKLSLFLLKFLLHKLEVEDELYAKMMFSESDALSTGRYRYCVATDQGTEIKSSFYYLESLQYLDLIFRLSIGLDNATSYFFRAVDENRRLGLEENDL